MKKIIIFSLIAIGALISYSAWFYWKNLRGAWPAFTRLSLNYQEIVNGLKIDPGFSLSVFADKLVNPRVITFDPNGVMIASITSEGKIIALPDKNKDGKADAAVTVAEGLDRPHGIAFYCDEKSCSIYIAETNNVSIYDYNKETFKATKVKKIIDLPSGGNHFTRTLLIAPIEGKDKLLVSVGSSCNVCHENDPRRAKVFYGDLDGENFKELAAGLRNTVFMALRPSTKDIWATEMGRDLIGDDIPPDEINVLTPGSNYGWPICYGKNIHDTDFDKNTYIINPCAAPFQTPSRIDIQAHSAPLGLAFAPEKSSWPTDYQNNLFVAFHGSWNRTIPTGYKIVRYELDDKGDVIGEMKDFITGWLKNGKSEGRPAGIVFDESGNMFISDDNAGVIYKVSYGK